MTDGTGRTPHQRLIDVLLREADMARVVADLAAKQGAHRAASRFEEFADVAEHRAALLKAALDAASQSN